MVARKRQKRRTSKAARNGDSPSLSLSLSRRLSMCRYISSKANLGYRKQIIVRRPD